MLEDDNKYLALAVSVEHEYFPPQHTWDQIGEMLH